MSGNTAWIAIGAVLLAVTAGLVAAGLDEAPSTGAKPVDETTGRIEAPFTMVERDRDSTRVQAPFVDIEVPRDRK